MDEEEGVEVDQDEAEAEEVVLGGGGVLALETTGILTQDAEPGSTTLVDS